MPAKTTRKRADYNLHDHPWTLGELAIRTGQQYVARTDLGDLKQGDVVQFVGFDDVDNHYGIFLFTDATGNLLEVAGDFAGPNHPRFKELEMGLASL